MKVYSKHMKTNKSLKQSEHSMAEYSLQETWKSSSKRKLGISKVSSMKHFQTHVDSHSQKSNRSTTFEENLQNKSCKAYLQYPLKKMTPQIKPLNTNINSVQLINSFTLVDDSLLQNISHINDEKPDDVLCYGSKLLLLKATQIESKKQINQSQHPKEENIERKYQNINNQISQGNQDNPPKQHFTFKGIKDQFKGHYLVNNYNVVHKTVIPTPKVKKQSKNLQQTIKLQKQNLSPINGLLKFDLESDKINHYPQCQLSLFSKQDTNCSKQNMNYSNWNEVGVKGKTKGVKCWGKEATREEVRGMDKEVETIKYKKAATIKHKEVTRLRQEVSIKDFKMGKKIGRGRFGNVYLAEEMRTKMIFAIKILNKKQIREEEMESQILFELKVQTYMSHPNVLQLYTFFDDQTSIYMVLEYADQCLFKKLNNNIHEKVVAAYIQQVLQSIKYLHSESILHRDIKPQNIMLCNDMIKIGDFGWAAYAPLYKRTTFCGTLDYVSPQIIKGNFYDEKVDIWSIGVLMYQLSTGKAPFQSNAKTIGDVERDTLSKIENMQLQVPAHLSVELRRLIYRILTKHPEVRLSIAEIENSEWMKQMNENKENMLEIVCFWKRQLSL